MTLGQSCAGSARASMMSGRMDDLTIGPHPSLCFMDCRVNPGNDRVVWS